MELEKREKMEVEVNFKKSKPLAWWLVS